MSRLERLTYILEFLKKGESFQLADISSRYQVSERTVFRDIKSLKNLGYRLEFKNGYRLSDLVPRDILANLSILQLELLKFSLDTHPLKDILPFYEMSKIFEKVLTGSERNLFFFKATSETEFLESQVLIKSPGARKIISEFISAADQNSSVSVSVKGKKGFCKYIPRAIHLKDAQLLLAVVEDSTGTKIEIPLNLIKQLSISH